MFIHYLCFADVRWVRVSRRLRLCAREALAPDPLFLRPLLWMLVSVQTPGALLRQHRVWNVTSLMKLIPGMIFALSRLQLFLYSWLSCHLSSQREHTLYCTSYVVIQSWKWWRGKVFLCIPYLWLTSYFVAQIKQQSKCSQSSSKKALSKDLVRNLLATLAWPGSGGSHVSGGMVFQFCFITPPH